MLTVIAASSDVVARQRASVLRDVLDALMGLLVKAPCEVVKEATAAALLNLAEHSSLCFSHIATAEDPLPALTVLLAPASQVKTRAATVIAHTAKPMLQRLASRSREPAVVLQLHTCRRLGARRAAAGAVRGGSTAGLKDSDQGLGCQRRGAPAH